MCPDDSSNTNSQDNAYSNSHNSPTQKNNRIRQYFLIALLLISFAAFLPIMWIFFVPILLAITFTALFYPLYSVLLRFFRGNKAISAALCCLTFLIGLLIPVSFLINIVIHQLLNLYSTAEPVVRELIEKGSQSHIIKELNELTFFKWIQSYSIDWLALLRDGIRRLASLGTYLINKTSSGILGLFANLFVTLFTMFYFFMDGEKILKRLRYLSPVRSQYQSIILGRFLLISKATIMGTILIGFIQGSLGALTLLIFGIDSWLLWGFIMIVLAIIPMAGTWIVLIPAGIIQIIIGDIWQGIGILLSSIIIVSNIDNIIRPRIVGHSAKMHDLLIFFSTLGGLSIFGITGFIIGPIIASFFITMIDIYEMEFHSNQEIFEQQ